MIKQHIFGTGFIVSKCIRLNIIHVKHMVRIMCVLRIRDKFKNYSYICAHAPGKETSEREKYIYCMNISNPTWKILLVNISSFRKGKSSPWDILEKTSEYGISIFHLFTDFNGAYDTIRRNKLLEALKEFKIPQKFVRLVKLTLKHARCSVKIHNN